ncbi:Ubiquitin domain-containing CTD phosphatase 1 [Daphnia magna]|uniref:Ubiquitin-like domain-containing CTD phosphatase 1 n=1 Tax=Daphnia magna TaxID=35525 RepID=A0A162PB89_9CRUS|nr:Ubiquitin domain-containing CTD phosphatase 1 [Daphnia magna]
MADALISFVVKWSAKEYAIHVDKEGTVLCLKKAIEVETGVKVERQKLLNLKFKAEDAVKLSSLDLKVGFKIMMMGSLEQDITTASTVPEIVDEIINDLDMTEEEIALENREEYLSKIAKRVDSYEIKLLNEPRQGKKLLVLDIDYTLFDHRSAAETGNELMRPFLHEFLTAAYDDYDIMIWSATSMKWIEEKMKLLGVSTNQNYKILGYLDYLAMISVHMDKYGLLDVKPLAVIWGKFSGIYSSKNTIMFDDIRRNFLMNPQNGLRIRAFRDAHQNRDKDRELLYLAQYLKDIAPLEDMSHLNHRSWEKYRPSKKHK